MVKLVFKPLVLFSQVVYLVLLLLVLGRRILIVLARTCLHGVQPNRILPPFTASLLVFVVAFSVSLLKKHQDEKKKSQPTIRENLGPKGSHRTLLILDIGLHIGNYEYHYSGKRHSGKTTDVL